MCGFVAVLFHDTVLVVNFLFPPLQSHPLSAGRTCIVSAVILCRESIADHLKFCLKVK